MISDLFDPKGFQRGLDLLRHHRYEPHVVQIFDRREADPGIKGDVELLDVETGAIRKVTITERNLRQYRRIFAAFLESVRTLLQHLRDRRDADVDRDPLRRAAAADDAGGGGAGMNLVNPAALLLGRPGRSRSWSSTS